MLRSMKQLKQQSLKLLCRCMMCKTLRKDSLLTARIHCHSWSRTLIDSITYHKDSNTEGTTSTTTKPSNSSTPPTLLLLLRLCVLLSYCCRRNTNATMIVKVVRVTVNDNHIGEMAKNKKCVRILTASKPGTRVAPGMVHRTRLKCYKPQ